LSLPKRRRSKKHDHVQTEAEKATMPIAPDGTRHSDGDRR
jgi:hypothetical protein